jgi:endonuclease YncB( thermonuclease family)
MAQAVVAEPLASGKYTVLSVTEGDLFTVDAEGKQVEVRLYGADAPEQGQGFFDEAKAYVEKQLKGKEVTIDAVTQEEGGRPVVVVRAPDSPVLHEDLVAQGLAWFDSTNVPDNATLKRLNASAIVEGKGLFKDATALAPWDFRKSNSLPAVVYLKQVEATPEPAKEEPKMLKAKGEEKPEEAKFAGASATAEPEQRMRITVGTPALPPGLDTGDVDVMGLVGRHAPRIATDSSGNPLGLTADNISQIPMAAQLGFQDGDIVQSINGTPIQSEMQVLGMVEQLKGSKNLNLQILRNGQPTTLNIPIP